MGKNQKHKKLILSMIDIIFLKVLQAIVVVKNNICVQHKIFLSSHGFFKFKC